MNKTICYHTRAANNNTVKLSGGSKTGALDQQTVDELVNMDFTVTVNPGGRAVFVDKEGRQVMLYISVDPSETIKGKEAIEQYYIDKHAREEKERVQREQESEELDNAMLGLSHEEILRRLKG